MARGGKDEGGGGGRGRVNITGVLIQQFLFPYVLFWKACTIF